MEETEELTQGRQASGGGLGRHAGVRKPSEIAPHVAGGRPGDRPAGKVAGEILQVPFVGRDGVGRRPPFRDQHFDEGFDLGAAGHVQRPFASRI